MNCVIWFYICHLRKHVESMPNYFPKLIVYEALGKEPSTSFMLGKHFTIWARSWPFNLLFCISIGTLVSESGLQYLYYIYFISKRSFLYGKFTFVIELKHCLTMMKFQLYKMLSGSTLYLNSKELYSFLICFNKMRVLIIINISK